MGNKNNQSMPTRQVQQPQGVMPQASAPQVPAQAVGLSAEEIFAKKLRELEEREKSVDEREKSVDEREKSVDERAGELEKIAVELDSRAEKLDAVERSEAKKADEVDEGILVLALQDGIYPNGYRREKGETFKIKTMAHFGKWMRLVKK